MSTFEHRRQASAPRASLACGLFLLVICPLALLAASSLPSQQQAAALKADPAVELPLPTKISHRQFTSNYSNGVEAPIRRALTARIHAEFDDALAFYRAEFSKRGWQDVPDGAEGTAENKVLRFKTPEGPGTLKLARAANETTVELVQRNDAAAAKANILPLPGQARLIFGYLVPDMASLAINGQTIKIAGGINHPQTLDLPPGTYAYQLLLLGRVVRSDSITVAADETWSLRLGSDEAAEQIY